MDETIVNVYTDGSLVKKGKDVFCGYGIYFPNGEYKSISRKFTHEPITNNRAELYAILKTIIICNKHGKFEQNAGAHLCGKGCKLCNESKGEIIIKKYLDNHNIEYVREKSFNECKNKFYLPFDFYLPNQNLLIEYDGLQHSKPIKFWGGENAYKKRQNNDEIKNNFAKNNNIGLLRIKYDQINNIEQILKNIL